MGYALKQFKNTKQKSSVFIIISEFVRKLDYLRSLSREKSFSKCEEPSKKGEWGGGGGSQHFFYILNLNTGVTRNKFIGNLFNIVSIL